METRSSVSPPQMVHHIVILFLKHKYILQKNMQPVAQIFFFGGKVTFTMAISVIKNELIKINASHIKITYPSIKDWEKSSQHDLMFSCVKNLTLRSMTTRGGTVVSVLFRTCTTKHGLNFKKNTHTVSY